MKQELNSHKKAFGVFMHIDLKQPHIFLSKKFHEFSSPNLLVSHKNEVSRNPGFFYCPKLNNINALPAISAFRQNRTDIFVLFGDSYFKEKVVSLLVEENSPQK